MPRRIYVTGPVPLTMNFETTHENVRGDPIPIPQVDAYSYSRASVDMLRRAAACGDKDTLRQLWEQLNQLDLRASV